MHNLTIQQIKNRLELSNLAKVARESGVSRSTLERIIAGGNTHESTVRLLSRFYLEQENK